MTYAHLTMQEKFNHVLSALRAQGVASVDMPGGSCLYRGPEGRKCAAGHLMTDEEYASAMAIANGEGDYSIEGKRASALHNYGLKATFGVPYEGNGRADFSNSLQHAHDHGLTKSMGAFEDYMRGVANTYGLTYEAP